MTLSFNSRTADVLNRGAGGYNSRYTRRFLHRSLAGETPDLTIIFLGNNDAIDSSSELQHVPIPEFRENILSILRSLHEINRDMRVILATPTQVDETLKPKHSNKNRAIYAQIIRDIVQFAQQHSPSQNLPKHIALLDVNDDNSSEFSISSADLVDGMHFNRAGNIKFFEALKQCINTHFPSFSPDFLPVKRRRPRANSDNPVLTTDAPVNHEIGKRPRISWSNRLESNKIARPRSDSMEFTEKNDHLDEEPSAVNEEPPSSSSSSSSSSAAVPQLHLTVPYWSTIH